MEKIKQVLLSLFVVVVSTVYVMMQPQKASPVIAQTNIESTTNSKHFSTNVTSENTEDSIVLTVPPEQKVSTTSHSKQNIDKPTGGTKQQESVPVEKQKKAPISTQTPTPKPVLKPIPKILPKGKYVDGVYTSAPENAYYGTVQIKTVVSGGKITAVDFLQYPNNRSTSRMINGQAMPLLQKEAITAQSAKVSGVSGATYTSRAFKKAMIDVVTKATG